jgi:hypothetical protein
MPAQPRKSQKKKAPAKPGDGLLGWFGRQVGHVKKAVQVDVTKPPVKTKAPPKAEPKPAPTQEVLYRTDTVEEVDHPTQPGVKLRRTTIDEVVVEKKMGEE